MTNVAWLAASSSSSYSSSIMARCMRNERASEPRVAAAVVGNSSFLILVSSFPQLIQRLLQMPFVHVLAHVGFADFA